MPDASLVADLERELAESHAQLEQMEFRLQRAYADAEEARARLQAEPAQAFVAASPTDDGSDLEVQQVRMELANAIDRARSAEERAAKLEADLLAMQHGVRELADADVVNDDDEGGADHNGDGDVDGDVDADGKSLRYRLARTAARKKLSGDLPTLS
jgi:phage shock protein A